MRNNTYTFMFGCFSLLLTSSTAFAAFVGGVETFGGTMIDLATWDVADTGSTVNVSQNDGLLIQTTGGGADLTTRSLMVGVGDVVRAHVWMDNIGGASSVNLYLTDNSDGPGQPVWLDDHYMQVGFSSCCDNASASVGGNGTSSGQNFAIGINTVQTDYILEIERLSLNSAKMAIYSAADQLLGSTIRPLEDFPEELHVAIRGSGGDGEMWFYQVSVPEPASSLMVLFIALLCGRFRCRHCTC